MVEKIISAGNKLDIETVNAGTQKVQIYKSQVIEIMENDQIRIAMPFEGTKLIVMSLDVKYKMCFYTENGLFECMGYIVDRYKSGNRYIAVVDLKTGLKKIQRREFFRLERLIDVEYRILSAEESVCESVDDILEGERVSVEPPIYKKGVAVDLSGGGARFILEDAYPLSTYVILKLNIGLESGKSDYCVIGKVVMSEKIPGKSGQCENRMEFVRIRETEREKLIHYIFNEERKTRRNRKS